MMLNSTSSSPLDLLVSNTSSALTGGAVAVPKDSFSNALTKNIVAMLVWLALSIINGSMVHTFLRHRYMFPQLFLITLCFFSCTHIFFLFVSISVTHPVKLLSPCEVIFKTFLRVTSFNLRIWSMISHLILCNSKLTDFAQVYTTNNKQINQEIIGRLINE